MSADLPLPRLAHTALVVVDVQARLVPAMAEFEPVLANLERLIRGCQALERPVVVTEQYPRGLGPTIEPLAVLVPGPYPTKTSFGCFGCEEFVAAVAPCQDLLICGIEAHVCVLQTALQAVAAGHRAFVAADAVTSRALANRDLALDQLRHAGVVVASTETLLFALLGDAAHPRFKAVSALVR